MQALRSVFSQTDSLAGDPLAIYAFSRQKNRWTRTTQRDRRPAVPDSPPPSRAKVLTWNVDFMESKADQRLQCILDHIQRTVFICTEGQAPAPCCILLQEIEAEVIPILLGHEWVRKHFHLSPISNWNWPGRAHYGNITLVSRSTLALTASSLVFRNSHMSRNALFVDLQLGAPKNAAEPLVFRVANVHLESLPQGAQARPEQLSLVAQALREPAVFGGIVGGDMNAIGESDRGTPKEVGLCDAYEGAEDDESAFTWGYQPECAFPPGRLDKILYTPGPGFTVEHPQRVGVGLKTAGGVWASDHYGLLTTLSIRE